MVGQPPESEGFARPVAHQLANLLTVVIGRSHVLLRTLPEDHPARADAEAIRVAGERAAKLLASDGEGGAQGSKR